jgi:hypothetical protein
MSKKLLLFSSKFCLRFSASSKFSQTSQNWIKLFSINSKFSYAPKFFGLEPSREGQLSAFCGGSPIPIAFI